MLIAVLVWEEQTESRAESWQEAFEFEAFAVPILPKQREQAGSCSEVKEEDWLHSDALFDVLLEQPSLHRKKVVVYCDPVRVPLCVRALSILCRTVLLYLPSEERIASILALKAEVGTLVASTPIVGGVSKARITEFFLPQCGQGSRVGLSLLATV